MCCGCWQEAGSPKIVNEKTKLVASLKPDIYEFGALHIIVDDWNLDEGSLDFCEVEIEKDIDSSPKAKVKEREFIKLLREMSQDERYSAFAIEGGCFVAPTQQ